MTDKNAKRLREASRTMSEVVDALIANGVPVDSCILAAELVRDVGRELGYRAQVLSVRVRVFGPDGQEGRHLGYAASVADDRYNGHVIVTWDGKVAIDVTAPQLSGDGVEIPAMAFEIPRSFRKGGQPFTLDVNGCTVTYTPFDDGGDWAVGRDAEIATDSARSARILAQRVRRR